MLLRSQSSPILNSWIPHAKEPSPEPTAVADLVPQIPRVRSVTHLTTSISFSSSSPSPSSSGASSLSPRRMNRTMSGSNISDLLPPPKRKLFSTRRLPSISLEEEKGGDGEEEEKALDLTSPSLGRLFSSSGLDASVAEDGIEDQSCEFGTEASAGATLVLDDEYVGGAGGSGRICGGRGGRSGADGGDGNGGFGFSDSNNSKGATEAYYQNMIEANPGNSLVLGNYAKFLKEVRGDLTKAEEYCERAILADQGDAGALSLYGDLIWERSKDAERAEGYFDRAVQAAPDDCYVMASYARFLWDAEDDEEEERNGEGKEGVKANNLISPVFFHGAASPSVAAAS